MPCNDDAGGGGGGGGGWGGDGDGDKHVKGLGMGVVRALVMAELKNQMTKKTAMMRSQVRLSIF